MAAVERRRSQVGVAAVVVGPMLSPLPSQVGPTLVVAARVLVTGGSRD